MHGRDRNDSGSLDDETRGGWRPPARDLRLGSEVGPYRLIDFLGAGGMGTVYLAEQSEPVSRRVALKVTHNRDPSGTPARESELRFAAERQALAKLSHPNVAQLYDSGEMPDGRPYFAMEVVEGAAITSFSDERQLPIRARLEIFLAVCRGVEHAHQKGVLHRDLKPDNVLVAEHDGQASAKVIDFGIAKGIDEPLAAVTQLTQQGVVGTLAYLSPEAIESAGGEIDLDTRADVFSLGVMLHELLVGARPQDFSRNSTAEVLQRILHAELPPPSSHFDSFEPDRRREIAELRGASVSALGGALAGDLDWIVARATAREREERYPSAGALAADIERHLADEAVEAGPPSAAYRARKFVRRHRAAVTAAALLLATLVLGVAGTAVGIVQARRAQLRAESEARAALQAREESESVLDFVVDLFETAAPSGQRADLQPVGEVLKRGAEQLESSLEEQPAVRARLLRTVGEIFKELGNYPDSVELLTQATEISRALAVEGPTEELVLAAGALGVSHVNTGDYEAAERILREAVAMDAQLHPVEERSVSPIGNLANALRNLGRAEEALEQRQRIVEILERRHRESPGLDLATALAGLAGDYLELGRREEGQATYQRAVSIARERGDDPYLLGIFLINLGNTYDDGTQLEMYSESYELLLDTVGPDHPSTLAAAYNLADADRQIDPERARARFVEVVPRLQKAYGPIHPNSLRAANGHGLAELHLGEFASAAERFQAILQRTLEVPGDVRAIRLEAAAALALACSELGRREEAQRALRIMFETKDDLEVQLSAHGESVVAFVELRFGQPEQAEAQFRRALELFEPDPVDPSLEGRIHLGHGRSLLALGDVDGARAAYRRSQASLTAAGLVGRFWLSEAVAAEKALDG